VLLSEFRVRKYVIYDGPFPLLLFSAHMPTTAAASTLRSAYAILSFSLNKPDEYVRMRAACPLKEAGHIRKKVCDGSVFAEI
jgi:hypothetical protein